MSPPIELCSGFLLDVDDALAIGSFGVIFCIGTELVTGLDDSG
jgi:hypothetical protein